MRDPERLRLERKGIEELRNKVNWLVGVEWLLGNRGLCFDAVISVKDHEYEVRVLFPTMYPDAPVIVRPQNMESRISTHQYGGADGPLCLEWGPDNWHSGVTSVEMLKSTYRLFQIEDPLGKDGTEIPDVAPSRHSLTVGQNLRGKRLRWLESKALSDFLTNQPNNSSGTYKFSSRDLDKTWVNMISEIKPIGGSKWEDPQVPKTILDEEVILRSGLWYKTNLESNDIGQQKTLSDIRTLLSDIQEAKFLATDGSSPIDGLGKTITGILILDKEDKLHFFIVLPDEDVLKCSSVQSENEPLHLRSPECNELSSKSIGIVGLGSVGSKIAVSLARMGSRNFYLVDHDLLLPENLQRHALDWRGIAFHKVDAMKAAIDLVSPGAQIKISRLHITGQESNAAVSGVLSRLSECDILIDATAESKVFNLLSAVSKTASIPIVWMEVYGGGLGGMIARSRPKIDPTPQEMRGAYLQYCDDNPAEGLNSTDIPYGIENDDKEVIVASDSDVTIIANHAARLVPDCFRQPDLSIFPYSMYLIGLTKGWVFKAPFSTTPISMESFSVEGWDTVKKQKLETEDIEFLTKLLEKDDNEASNTS